MQTVFMIWIGTSLDMQATIAIESFYRAYGGHPLHLYTTNTIEEISRAMEKSLLTTPAVKSVVPHSIDFHALAKECASKVGVELDDRMQREWFKSPVVRADVIRMCIAFMNGGFYFDADIVHVKAWPKAALAERAVSLGDLGCPNDDYYRVFCRSVSGEHSWLPNNKTLELSGTRYVVNALFNFPFSHDAFLADAIRFCFTSEDTAEGAKKCWNCCGPRAFSYALKNEDRLPKLLASVGTIYIGDPMFTYHIFGKSAHLTDRALQMLNDTAKVRVEENRPHV